MVGNVTTTMKKHSDFLEVAAQLKYSFPECRYIIFGNNSNLTITPYTRHLSQISNSLQLDKLVVWADHIDDVPAMMNSFDILIHPASEEGSGRVIMEAMAAGRSVIGIKLGGVRELIQNGITGFLVSPGDIQALSNRAALMLEDHQLRKEIGLRAKRYSEQNFTNESTMNSIQVIYQQFVNL